MEIHLFSHHKYSDILMFFIYWHPEQETAWPESALNPDVNGAKDWSVSNTNEQLQNVQMCSVDQVLGH